MSDPIPSYDVEDVLSSIRKLVADGQEQGGNVEQDQSDQDDKATSKGALLLTPNFRVDVARSATVDPPRVGLSNLHTALSSDGDAPKGESIVQNLRETWVAPKPDEYYEDESEDGLASFKPGGRWSPDPADEADKAAEAAEVTDATEETVAEISAPKVDSVDDEDPEFQWKHRELGQVVQDVDDVEEDTSQRDSVLSELRAVRAPIETFANDGSEEERITIPRFRHRGWSYDLASAAGWNTDRTPEPEAVESPPAEEAQPEEAQTKKAITEDVSAEVTPAEPEPVHAPETVEASVQAAASELAPGVATQIAPQVAQKANTGLLDGATIDEEMLRDIVADILREEMSGALGERITRNVRKLVRREIHRAMMTQDFD